MLNSYIVTDFLPKPNVMEFNDYASVDLKKLEYHFPIPTLSKSKLEISLIFIVAFLGLIGSGYIITLSSNANNQPEFHNLSLLAASTGFDGDNSSAVKNMDLDEVIEIRGDFKTGERLTFILDADLDNGMRYMMDMGDGSRTMIRRNRFTHTYTKPGKYTLKFKATKNSVVQIIAEKTIKIKK